MWGPHKNNINAKLHQQLQKLLIFSMQWTEQDLFLVLVTRHDIFQFKHIFILWMFGWFSKNYSEFRQKYLFFLERFQEIPLFNQHLKHN